MKLDLFINLLIISTAVIAYSDTTGLRSDTVEVENGRAVTDSAVNTRLDAKARMERKLFKFKFSFPPFTRAPVTPRPTPTPTKRPMTIKCGAFADSLSVQKMFNETSSHWGQCRSYFSKITLATSVIGGSIDIAIGALSAAEKASKSLKSTADTAFAEADKSLSKLKGIPKVGKVIKIFVSMLDKARKIIGKVYSRLVSYKKFLGKLSNVFKRISRAFRAIFVSTGTAQLGYAAAALVTEGAIGCTNKTAQCEDDSNVEYYHSGIKNAVSTHLAASKVCPKTFQAIAEKLDRMAAALKAVANTVFKAIEDAINAVRQALQPVMDAIEKVMKEVGKHLSEAYCCLTPLHLQVGLKFLGQIMDLATCPADGARKGLENTMLLLEAEMNKLVKEMIVKLVAPVSNVAILVPTVNAGSVSTATCSIRLPTVSSKIEKPFQLWIDALKVEKPSISVLSEAPAAFGKSVKKACDDALGEVGKGLGHDCCRIYHPLKDGLFCDPTNVVRYKRCTQCASGTHSWWFDRFHIACGKAPCGKDGKPCGKGTTCNQCCNGHSYWWSKAFTMCGKEPCWKDGRRCALGTTCNACCKRATWWPNKFFTACGKMPCWKKNTRCLGGTSCRNCCKGSKWIWNKFGHFCK